MAYAQHPRYDAPLRPLHQNHQPIYNSSREHYAGRNGNGPRSPASDFNTSSRPGPTQEYQYTDELLGRSYGYSQEWSNQNKSSNGNIGRYGFRGQHRDGRWPPARQPQGIPMAAGGHPDDDSRNPGPPPGRGRYFQQDPYDQSDNYNESLRYQQHLQPVGLYHSGLRERENRDHEYDEFSLEKPDNWTPTQHYDHPSHVSDWSHHDSEWNPVYPQQDLGDAYEKTVSPDTYGNHHTPRLLKAPASTLDHTQPKSDRSRNPQPPNPRKLVSA